MTKAKLMKFAIPALVYIVMNKAAKANPTIRRIVQ